MLLFGGQSAEHEVSVKSAQNVYEAFDKAKYELELVYIAKNGSWYEMAPKKLFSSVLGISNNENFFLTKQKNELTGPIFPNLHKSKRPEVIFPLLHGPMGEDGTIQGMLKVLGIPFVGSNVLGSAIGMDKDIMKRLLREAGLPIGRFKTLRSFEINSLKDIEREFTYPLFVKPANLGSSVGVSKVCENKNLKKAIREAFKYDRKVIVEEYIKGQEMECAVLGNEIIETSVVGEVVSTHEFYDYEAKYLDRKATSLKIPADIPLSIQNKIQELAVAAFKTLEACGLARVDFFLTDDQKVYVNEINTMPGFTKTSMYPLLWEASGISYKDLLERLIDIALENNKGSKSSLETH